MHIRYNVVDCKNEELFYIYDLDSICLYKQITMGFQRLVFLICESNPLASSNWIFWKISRASYFVILRVLIPVFYTFSLTRSRQLFFTTDCCYRGPTNFEFCFVKRLPSLAGSIHATIHRYCGRILDLRGRQISGTCEDDFKLILTCRFRIKAFISYDDNEVMFRVLDSMLVAQ